ncbi:hypothetical protein, partial [Lentzea sp. NPDC004782]|uniref:hypothetical protein n=1 Tax=Lentzea sp. NPDC004782 TaxID=3154458 RepID=UPI0033B03522
MPEDFRATALERAVGRKLAGWRNALDLSLTEAGGRVGFSSAKLSMMENAMQPSAPVGRRSTARGSLVSDEGLLHPREVDEGA